MMKNFHVKTVWRAIKVKFFAILPFQVFFTGLLRDETNDDDDPILFVRVQMLFFLRSRSIIIIIFGNLLLISEEIARSR
jgi:hypothetical protein